MPGKRPLNSDGYCLHLYPQVHILCTYYLSIPTADLDNPLGKSTVQGTYTTYKFKCNSHMFIGKGCRAITQIEIRDLHWHKLLHQAVCRDLGKAVGKSPNGTKAFQTLKGPESFLRYASTHTFLSALSQWLSTLLKKPHYRQQTVVLYTQSKCSFSASSNHYPTPEVMDLSVKHL